MARSPLLFFLNRSPTLLWLVYRNKKSKESFYSVRALLISALHARSTTTAELSWIFDRRLNWILEWTESFLLHRHNEQKAIKTSELTSSKPLITIIILLLTKTSWSLETLNRVCTSSADNSLILYFFLHIFRYETTAEGNVAFRPKWPLFVCFTGQLSALLLRFDRFLTKSLPHWLLGHCKSFTTRCVKVSRFTSLVNNEHQ